MSGMRDIPAALVARPFTVRMAASVGVTPRQLRGRRCRMLFKGVYVGADVELTVELMAAAVALILPLGAVVGGRTAALLHGADVRRRGDVTIDVIVSRDSLLRRPGVRATAALLEPGDVAQIAGILVTSAVRTAFDLARQRDLIEAVVGVDAMLNRGGAQLNELTAYVASHRGWRGIRWADAALIHAEPLAESPMESRQRMRLVLAGLPRPRAQVKLYVRPNVVRARLDHGYPEWKVGPEYDGDPHEDQWRADNERQQWIRDQGWWHRRYTSLSIQSGWEGMVSEVGAALVARGWRP
jgi:hypothetical protein